EALATRYPWCWHLLMNRARRLAILPLVVLTVAFAGCARPAPPQPTPTAATPRRERLDQGLAAASRFLGARQDTDGAWRSDIYATLRAGPALPPLVISALPRLPAGSDQEKACRQGAAYLAGMVKDDGAIDAGPHGLSYPVYISAQAVVVLS